MNSQWARDLAATPTFEASIVEGGCRVDETKVVKEALLKYADLLEKHKDDSQCDDPECACHHPDGHHDKIEKCPKCGGNGRVYKDCSGYYYVACTKCRHQLTCCEVTEYWAVRRWNESSKEAEKGGATCS